MGQALEGTGRGPGEFSTKPGVSGESGGAALGLTDREIRYAEVPAGLNHRELRDQKIQGLVLRVY